ncbi:hypothetical protein Tco_0623833 [Tanacetum coccineum]|uniref:Ribosomal protein S4 n=1 Tax=Tanacetum coccineum TaxID=301880 RepID=A0ABQ4WCA3_9ASTR
MRTKKHPWKGIHVRKTRLLRTLARQGAHFGPLTDTSEILGKLNIGLAYKRGTLTPPQGFSSLGRSREVFLLTLVCGSRDALPSLVVPLVHLSLPLVSLFFQPRTYNLSTLPFRDSVQIVENDLVVKKFPENDLACKKFPKNGGVTLEVLSVRRSIHPHIK